MIPDLQDQLKLTVQPHTDAKDRTLGGLILGAIPSDLAQWGTRQLDLHLRKLSHQPHSTLFTGARHTLAMQIASTGWTIEGSNRARVAQELLQMADFGGGWKNFVSKLVKDYTTYCFGAVVEIIGAGKVDKPLVGRPVGISVLDPLRCWATGDPVYPIAYRPKWVYHPYGRDLPQDREFHLMHHTRVFRLIDMPDSEEGTFEYGESALYRYYGHWQRQHLLGKYVIESLSDQPPTGLVTTNNLRAGDWELAQRQYEAQRSADGSSVWRNIMRLEGLDPTRPIDVKFTPFASVPQGFDYRTYEEIDAARVALAFGIDPQDIQPLSGGLAGTSGQSYVLLAKARGKMQGVLFAEMERFINTRLLPPSLEFSFQPEDAEKEKIEADKADVWIKAIGTAPLSELEKRRVLARVVEVIGDIVTDESGEVVELPDDDVREEVPVEVEDAEQPDEPVEPLTPSEEQLAPDDTALKYKDYNSTRLDFTADVADAIDAFVAGEMDRVRFGVVMRGHISKYGRRAYMDGLEAGGVSVDVLDDSDLLLVKKLVADASVYVTNLGAEIASGVQINGEARAEAWGNKTLEGFYQEALLAADRNGMYEFAGDDGHESCRTCIRLKGQRHRLKDWERKGLRPRVDTSSFECGGWRCRHKLVRVAGSARGNW